MPTTKDLFGDSSDDDDDVPPQQEVAAAAKPAADADVAMEEDSDSAPPPAAEESASAPNGDNAKNDDDDDDDDDAEMKDDDQDRAAAPAPPPPPKIVHQPTLRLPSTSTVGPHTTLHVTKLPNLMGLQPQPFDEATFLPSVEEEEFGAAMASTLVRWRYKKDEDGTAASGTARPMESNSRIVEWEDGSWTMHIGTDSFEMDFKDHGKPGFPGFNGYLYQSHQAHVGDEDDADDPAANVTTVLECVAPIASRVTVHPSSLQSTAHQSLTVAVRQKTLKQARIATLATQDDPELIKQERIRAADDLQKARSKGRAGATTGATGGRRSGGGGRPRMSRDYLEENDEAYDTTNIRGMKRKAREGGDDFDDYGDDDDDDDDDDEETFRKAGTRRRAAAAAAEAAEKEDEEEEELVMDNDDDDDEEDEAAPLRKKKATHRNVIDEDDSDDE